MKLIRPQVDGIVAVSLSRKNIEGLLAQLDDYAASVREPRQIMRNDEGTLLVVVAEENDAHYGDRLSGASAVGQKYGEAHA